MTQTVVPTQYVYKVCICNTAIVQAMVILLGLINRHVFIFWTKRYKQYSISQSKIINVNWKKQSLHNSHKQVKYCWKWGFRSSTRLLGRQFILFGLEKVQLGSMTLLFSSFLSFHYFKVLYFNYTVIVKIQLNDNKFKNINLLFTTQYKLFT